eukprot:jgi/Tetstr1/436580/TSEL_025377.t1
MASTAAAPRSAAGSCAGRFPPTSTAAFAPPRFPTAPRRLPRRYPQAASLPSRPANGDGPAADSEECGRCVLRALVAAATVSALGGGMAAPPALSAAYSTSAAHAASGAEDARQRVLQVDRNAVEMALQRKFASRLRTMPDDQLLSLLMETLLAEGGAEMLAAPPTAAGSPPVPPLLPSPPQSSAPAAPSAPRLEELAPPAPTAPRSTEELLGVPDAAHLFSEAPVPLPGRAEVAEGNSSGGSGTPEALREALNEALSEVLRGQQAQELAAGAGGKLAGAVRLAREEAAGVLADPERLLLAARALLPAALLAGGVVAGRALLRPPREEGAEAEEEQADAREAMETMEGELPWQADVTSPQGEASSGRVLWTRPDDMEGEPQADSSDDPAENPGGSDILWTRAEDEGKPKAAGPAVLNANEPTSGGILWTREVADSGEQASEGVGGTPAELAPELGGETPRPRRGRGRPAVPQPARSVEGVMDNVEALPLGGRAGRTDASPPPPPQRPPPPAQPRGQFL